MVSVDVLTPLGPGEAVRPRVLEALRDQGRVHLDHHIVRGAAPGPGEPRAAAIARARNLAKCEGTARYALFLDSDVVLPPRGVERLLCGLLFNRHHAALAINYQEEAQGGYSLHVAMGAVLFVRSVLERITFRTEPGLCECYCCCLDLRRMGYRIDYLPGLRAEHLR